MHAGSYEIFAQLLNFFSEATSSPQCVKYIPECKPDVKLKCEVYDVMRAGSYDVFAHLRYLFSDVTSPTIVFQIHSRMQD